MDKKVNVHIGWLVLFALLLIFATYLITDYFSEPSETVNIKTKGDHDIITFRLPNSHDPNVFGPPTWEARHALAEWTPCPACRTEAMSHEIFFHDYVNRKKNKDFFDKKNYEEWIKKLSKQKA